MTVASQLDRGIAPRADARLAGNGSTTTDLAQPPAGQQESGPVLPRQAARGLRYIATHPGSSSTQVQAALGIRHPSQVSALLHRLERRGLAHTDHNPGAPNAWRLTDHGRAQLSQLPEEIYG